MDSNYAMSLPVNKERTFSVNFACQRCCQPLKLHSSFRDLDEQALSELSQPLFPNTDREDAAALIENYQTQTDESMVMKKILLPIRLPEMCSDFMVIDDLSNLPLDNDKTLKVTATLFEIMSEQSDIDHPLCDECTDNLLDQMDQTLKTDEDDFMKYKKFLENLDVDKQDDDADAQAQILESNRAVLAKLEATVEDLEKELSCIEAKTMAVKETRKTYEDEAETLQREGDKQFQELCRIERQLLLAEDSQMSVNNQLMYAQAQLDKLKQTNVFNATFHIWHSGHFGTINNFRLGRLPNVPVEWAEINAAWGQTVLLLHSLARKINLTFERFRLVPYGNQSYIESLENKSKDLPLYCAGGFRFMLDHKFDLAMVAFLDCLQQFKEKVESGDASFHLPYRMDKGKVEDKSTGKTYSIKAQFNSEEQWTKALKFMLTNLKWALAWVSTQFQDSAQE